MKKSKFSVNSIEILPSRIALILYSSLAIVALMTVWIADFPLWLRVCAVLIWLAWVVYECWILQHRGRLIRIDYINDEQVQLHYARGDLIEGRISSKSLATRYGIFYVVEGLGREHAFILFPDALYLHDYRRLTVNLLWLRQQPPL